MTEPQPKGTLLGWAVLAACAVGIFALGMLASSITERRTEAVQARLQFMQPVSAFEADNAKWGVSFPREYGSWESTKQLNENTKYGGSSKRDYLAESPALVILWAGYSFSKEYNQARGHYWAIEDVTRTRRVDSKTPATCWTCKSPDVPRLMAKEGPAAFYAGNFMALKGEIRNPIGCADCHDNETMALHISRPALKEGFSSLGKDVARADQQSMRSLVCAQCHSSYYFRDKTSNYLVFPWSRGLTADDFDAYYQRTGFSDWTHAISGARMIKLRHPDFEVYQQGIHAFRGVACADCHMPYRAEGGIKYTDHQVRSPLYNVENSCQVCHRWSEREVRERVTAIQDATAEMRRRAESAIAAAHLEIGDAMRLGATDSELARSRDLVRRAQMYWDYVGASNGMGFHAPQECGRVLDKALDLASQCRLEANRVRARHGALEAYVPPDLSTKAKAQAFVSSRR